MNLYQVFFEKFILPLFNPAVIARSLAKKQPDVAAGILQQLRPEKCVQVLSFWSVGVKTIILNEMGEKVLKLFPYMSYEDRARMLITLSSSIIKKYSREITKNDLDKMIDYWSQNDLKVALLRFSKDVGQNLVEMLDDAERFEVIKDLKPWVQASLVEKLPVESRAYLINGFDIGDAIELFYRWDLNTQSQVLKSISENRQQEIYKILSPKNIAALMEYWDLDKIKEVMLNFDEERLRYTFISLSGDVRMEVFPELPEERQVDILNTIDTMEAVELVGLFSKEQAENLIRKLNEDQAQSIRMGSFLR
jgi:Mg/Co/Ni transporter MgtE